MTLLLTGLMPIELMDSEGMRSVVVVQVGLAAVKSAVCQTPPLTLPANTCLLFEGATARASMAPTSWLVASVGPLTLPALICGLRPSGAPFGTPLRISV